MVECNSTIGIRIIKAMASGTTIESTCSDSSNVRSDDFGCMVK